MTEEILERDMPIEAYVDIKTVFDILDKDGTTSERRLRVVGSPNRLSRITLIILPSITRNTRVDPRRKNTAVAFTKQTISQHSPLWNIMCNDVIDIN